MNRSRSILLVGLLMAIAVTATAAASPLPWFRHADLGPEWLTPSQVAALAPISEFQLTDQRGRTVTRSTLDDHLVVVNFFFSQCPGICPTTMTQMARVDRLIGVDSRVLLLSLSVTPDEDSVQVLADYARARHFEADNWHLLTGPAGVAQRLARRDFFADLPDAGADAGFVHTEKVFLLDRAQHIRGVYNGTSAADMDRLAGDLGVLLDAG